MAAAVVKPWRVVMRQAFIQAQMIEQLSVGVMTAEPSGDFRITYLNAEARQLLETVQDAMGVQVDNLIGQSIDVIDTDTRRQRDLVADPANLPHLARGASGLGRKRSIYGSVRCNDRDGRPVPGRC